MSDDEGPATHLPAHEPPFVAIDCMKNLCSADPTLYELGYLALGRKRRGDPKLPVLARIHSIPDMSVWHICPIDHRMFQRLLDTPLLVGPISSAITECFWTLLEWDIDPLVSNISLHVSPAIEQPYDGENVMLIQIPRDSDTDRMKLWTHIDSVVFAKVPHTILTTCVERVDIGPDSFPRVRSEPQW